MRACRKYWLIAVSSFFRTPLRCWMTFLSPFMALLLVPGDSDSTRSLVGTRLTPGVSKAQGKCVTLRISRKDSRDLTHFLCDLVAIAARLRIIRNTVNVE